MRSGPTVTLSCGATATSRPAASMPCSSSFGCDEREREPRAVHRAVDSIDHVGDGADVVLVAVRQHERANAPAIRIEHVQVGNDEVDAEQLGLGKHDAGIDEDSGIAAGDEHHVHAELAQPAERNDIQHRGARGARRRHRQLTSTSVSPDTCPGRASARPSTGTAQARRNSRPRCPVKGVAGKDPKNRQENSRNYSTAPRRTEANSSASPAISVTCSVSGRRRPSSPEIASTAAPVGSKRLSAFEQRLPPLGEQGFDEPLESGLVAHAGRGWPELQPDEARADLGRRPEGSRRQLEEACRLRVHLDEHRERAVVARGRTRDETIRDLALEHQRRVGEQPGLAMEPDQVRDHRRRQVIREVADDPKPPPDDGVVASRPAGRWGCRPLRERQHVDVEKVAREDRDVRRDRGAPGLATRSRSISTARMGAPVAASGSVSAPVPGPISTNTSPAAGWMAATTFWAQAAARKCWLNRLRGTCRPGRRSATHRPRRLRRRRRPHRPASNVLRCPRSLLPRARSSARLRGSASRRSRRRRRLHLRSTSSIGP